jgi:hypothetical protein
MKASLIKFTCAAALGLLVAACGGGGGGGVVAGGTGGTGIASGQISGFGSIFVNGVEFNCSNATIVDDDGTIDQRRGDAACAEGDLLALNMIVRVDGSVSGSSGNATRVHVSPILRGPVSEINTTNGTFKVLQQTVVVEDATRFKINNTAGQGLTTGLPLLAQNMVVQVFGFVDSANNNIVATFVRTRTDARHSANEFEIKGIVTVSGDVVTIGNFSINLGSFPAPANGACVELKGSISGNTLTLIRAPKTDDDCNGGLRSDSGGAKAEVEGIVSGVAGTAPELTFKVGGQEVKTNASTTYPDGDNLQDGVKVEVEGPISGGVMTASKVQIKTIRRGGRNN